MSLFDGFRKKRNCEGINTNPTISPEPETETLPEESVGFYFENPTELAIYGKHFGKGKTVYWLSGDNYQKEYQKGYALFEQRQFAKALEIYMGCLKLNPIGISARFEICETYIKLRNFPKAKQTLFDMKEFLVDEKSIAQFYRRMGFIEIEEHKYSIATACYLFSQKFEKHPSVEDELKYIKSKSGFGLTGDPEKILIKAQIPILTQITLE